MPWSCPPGGGAGFVCDEQYFRLQKGTLAVQFEHFKALAAFHDQIETPVGILLRDSNDFSRTPNFRQALVQGADHAERRVVCPTLADHLFVARLENVQGQGSAGEQHNVEREQGKQGHEVSDWHSCSAAVSAAVTEASCLRMRGQMASRQPARRNDAAQNPPIVRQECKIVRHRPPRILTCRVAEGYNASMELVGKVVVVTGASMGIGEAIAKVFAEEGASVILLSRDAARAEAARVRIGLPERTAALSCDVRNSEEIDRVLALTLHHFKRVDVWINNAGHGLLDSVAQTDMRACHDLFETNFFGAMSAMQAVIPVMRQQGGGAIINISSVAGHIAMPFHASYSATKFALNAIGKAAGVELKNDGIHVLTVCPGYVRTAFSENAVRGNELKKVRPSSVRGITAERVARATLRGYLKQKREVIVPWTMHVPVKLYQLFPVLVEWAMGRMAK